MAEGVHVRFAGELEQFIQNRVSGSGLYSSASEYIWDLVRLDYEREERRKALRLRQELKPGLDAADSAFMELNADTLIAEAKERRADSGR